MKSPLVAILLIMSLFIWAPCVQADDSKIPPTDPMEVQTLVSRTIVLNNGVLLLMDQIGAPVGSKPKNPSLKQTLILVGIIAGVAVGLTLWLRGT